MSVTLPDGPRVLIEADLAPLQGTRFQPTGFPDLGAAAYQLHDGTAMLIVESAQSVANRLEATAWDSGERRLLPLLDGIPYVSVIDADGRELTNSILEAHRLNSAYIEKSSAFDEIKSQVGHADGQPFDQRRLVRAVAKYDFNSLLHGVFLESIAGVLRIPRALSGFIEARDVRTVTSGGVKNDRVRAGTEKGSEATAKEGFGNVPYHRDEFTAARVTAYFNFDLSQVRSYGLGEGAESLLFALGLWKIHAFLDSGLRLRTACDFEVTELRVTRPHGFSLPGRADLEDALPGLIADARSTGLFADPPITQALYGTASGSSAKRRGRAKPEEAEVSA